MKFKHAYFDMFLRLEEVGEREMSNLEKRFRFSGALINGVFSRF